MFRSTLAVVATLAVTSAVFAQGHQHQGTPKPAIPKAATSPAPATATPAPAAAAPAAPAVDHSKVDHSKMGHGTAAAGDTASTTAFKAANDKMHGGMAIPFSGNADVDFIRGMIPHHEGAVDMASIVLAHGKDAKVKKLARDIIAAQNKEIAFMKSWLAKNAK